MNVQIQGGGKNSGVYANTGSSAALVEYLQHEDAERLAAGLDTLPFFNAVGVEVSAGEVIKKLDRNHKKLHYEDAKFFHLDLNPSQHELRAMGTTDEEIIEGCKKYALAMSQAYAENFNKEVIIGQDENGNPITRPLSAEDLMLFWKIHMNRSEKEGLQVHIHGVPSRKDIHNKLQLSPKTNHKGTKAGPVKGGFERTSYYKKAEKVFDEMFGYNRAITETFEYYLAQKRGKELKESQKAQITSEIVKKEQSHKMNVLLSRTDKVEVSKKADELRPETSNKIQEALTKRERRRRNEYWNDYHSKYRPMYNELKTACDNSFSLYREAKEQYGICSQAITDRYTQLKGIYAEMDTRQNDIVAAKTAKGLWKAASALVFCLNPIAGIVMGLAGSIVAEASISSSSAARRSLGAQVASIRQSIENLKAEQAELRQDKADRLKVYIENKEAKAELLREINALRDELLMPVEAPKPKMRFDFKAAASQKNPLKVANTQQTVDIYSVMMSAGTRKEFDAALLTQLVAVEPTLDRFGGVSDFRITLARDGRVTNASGLVSSKQLRSMLDKWQGWTGQTPAYRLAIERDRKAQLEDICRKLAQVFPKAAPMLPKDIAYRNDGSVLSVSFVKADGVYMTLNVDTDNYIRLRDGSAINITSGKYYRPSPVVQEECQHGQKKGIKR